MTTDPIADYLTRLRNAIMAGKKVVTVPASGIKKDITRILYDKGYILSYKLEDDGKQGLIKIALKYGPDKRSAIQELTRVSSPGLRQYTNASQLPRVLNGLGVAIISTSRGVVTDKEARTLGVGGEVICYVS
ncbi:MAG: 30S ribosomal protein S8 [Flavobacteriales bacterium]|nr:30S ribosomal protein S8 [Flavobacteriales bacterium]MEB2340759.1 30S ribosomal protein S8 [Flavobacteriia bacterium]